MGDFIVYVLFWFIGVLFASFIGYHFTLWFWHRSDGKRTGIAALVTAIITIFGASR